MSVILDTTGVSNALSSSSASTTASNNDENTQVFLDLLLTQLQNQNPLDPMDTEEYTSQLVQYSSLEQLMTLNEAVSAQSDLLKSQEGSSLLDFIGKQVEIDSDTSVMQEGQVAWSIDLGESAESIEITIRNSNDEIVYQGTAEAAAGEYDFVLDSEDFNGSVADGQSLKLEITALDDSGSAVSSDITAYVTVEKLDTSGSESDDVLLMAGELGFTSAHILNVGSPTETADDNTDDEQSDEEIAA